MKRSRDVAPWVSRAVRQNKAEAIRVRLLKARKQVERGWSLTRIVADGTLIGWSLRMLFTGICGDFVVDWDQRRGRTKLERVAVVERAIAEIGEAFDADGEVVS